MPSTNESTRYATKPIAQCTRCTRTHLSSFTTTTLCCTASPTSTISQLRLSSSFRQFAPSSKTQHDALPEISVPTFKKTLAQAHSQAHPLKPREQWMRDTPPFSTDAEANATYNAACATMKWVPAPAQRLEMGSVVDGCRSQCYLQRRVCHYRARTSPEMGPSSGST
jgi:hypothetical protein